MKRERTETMAILAARWHIVGVARNAINDRTACGQDVYTSSPMQPARTIPEDERCRRAGCAKWWPPHLTVVR